MSETDTARYRLAPYCTGNGVDIGFGGWEPIVPWAICIDRPEGDGRRADKEGQFRTHYGCDAFLDLPFKDQTLDFVYSSHTLEDAVNTRAVLCEWLRVLKVGGNLVLFLPDQQTYVRHCESEGSIPNQAHVHSNFSLQLVIDILLEIGGTEMIHSLWPVTNNPYSFDLVMRKTKHIPDLVLSAQEMAAATAATLLSRVDAVVSSATAADQYVKDVRMFLKNNMQLFKVDAFLFNQERIYGKSK